jgi:4-hydroxy 2-oxovalerate aldolase
VHLHDALGLAFANALTAIELGIRWVDASVLGMGRGSGNLRTELLVQHLEFHVGDRQRRSAPLHALIASTWQPLSDRYRWGPHPAYAYAAQLGLHPSYPQALVTEHGLALSSIFSILEILARRVDRRRFDHGALLEARATHASEHEVLA